MAAPQSSLGPNQRLTEFAGRVVLQRAEQLAYLVERTAQKPRESAIHRLRVAARRLGSALDALSEHFPARGVAKVQRKARKLRQAAGGVRDRDIALALAQEVGLDLTKKATARVEKGRTESAGALGGRLDRLSQKSLAASWSRALGLNSTLGAAAPSPTAATYAAALLPQLAKEYFEAGHEAAAPAATIESLHEFRKLGKRFRYTLEIFDPCYGEDLQEALQLLRGLQDILGMINDCESAEGIIRKAVRRGQRERVHELLYGRKMALVDNFRSHWQETFAAEDECRIWMQMLAKPAFAPGSDSTSDSPGVAAAS